MILFVPVRCATPKFSDFWKTNFGSRELNDDSSHRVIRRPWRLKEYRGSSDFTGSLKSGTSDTPDKGDESTEKQSAAGAGRRR
jgi:hypothetical protein